MVAAAQNRRRFPLPFAISAAIAAVLRRHALARRMSALFLVVHVLHCLLYSGHQFFDLSEVICSGSPSGGKHPPDPTKPLGHFSRCCNFLTVLASATVAGGSS